MAIYRYKPTYTHGEMYTRARARTHRHSWPRTCMYCMSQPVIRMKTMIYKYTHVAIYRLGSGMDGAPGAERMQCATEPTI